jgi:hypothetical protein
LRHFFIIFFLSNVFLNAQIKDDDYVLEKPRDYSKDPAVTANYIELLGNGGLYSLNFDRVFVYRKKFKISGRIGGNIWPNGRYLEQAYVVENNYIFFDGDHHFEVGPGLTLQRKYNPVCSDTTQYPKYNWESVWFGMFRLGYRYQKEEEGFFFRFGLTPILYRKYDCATDIPPGNWFWLGIAFGVTY